MPPQRAHQATRQPDIAQAPAAALLGDVALEVRLLWGDTVLDHAHFHEATTITVGESRKNTFALSSDALPHDRGSFPLLQPDDEGLSVHFVESMGGWVEWRGCRYTLAQLMASQLTTPAGDVRHSCSTALWSC